MWLLLLTQSVAQLVASLVSWIDGVDVLKVIDDNRRRIAMGTGDLPKVSSVDSLESS